MCIRDRLSWYVRSLDRRTGWMVRRRGSTGGSPMDEQRVATEQSPFRAFGSPSGAATHDVEPLPTPTLTAAPLSPRGEDEAITSQARPSDGAPTASLVGSLSDFTLPDVLTLLATTGKTGEFQVAGQTVDGRLWLDHGTCLLYTSPSPRDGLLSRMPS